MHSNAGDKSTCHLKKCVKYCKLESCRYKNPPPEFSERECDIRYKFCIHSFDYFNNKSSEIIFDLQTFSEVFIVILQCITILERAIAVTN